MDAVLNYLKNRVSDDVLKYSLVILATNGWERSEDASFAYEALDTLAVRFQIPWKKHR